MGKAGHETDRNWVSADHDNRDRAGRLFGSEARRRAPGYDDISRQANQLGGWSGIALGTALCEAVLDLQPSIVDVSERAHPVAQAFERRPGLIGENADATDVRAPLGDGSERRGCCRAAEQRDELA